MPLPHFVLSCERNPSMQRFLTLIAVLSFFWGGCGSESDGTHPSPKTKKFTALSAEQTGIDFQNPIAENDSINIIRYDYLYNGGGVAAADVNNDGWIDLYFTGNQVADRLYLNNGDMTFTDASEKWGIANYPGWSSGAVFADVNNDGFLDLYVCRTGPHTTPETRTNRLFINQKGAGFTEMGEEYGLNYTGHSTQAAFFDADGDGDLDVYLMTHPDQFRNRLNLSELQKLIAEGLLESDRFFRNDGGRFTDVSQAVGIGDFAFGLGLVVDDFNSDGHLDIYVSNDFDEGDLLYLNDGTGKFTNAVTRLFKHTANYGMGCDAADINNDGFVDLVQADMAFETHERAKRNMASMNPERFDLRVQLGWHYQYMANMLQVNNGDGTFSEIAQAAGVHKTDWSWATLFADFDLDGYQDLFITNGYKRDTKDNDLRQKVADLTANGNAPTVDEILNLIPSTALRNYMFRNIDGLQFSRVNDDWGLNEAINSNGAVYADLDNDGDLDLVINNLDAVASVYRNDIVDASTNRFTVDLHPRHFINRNTIGCLVEIKTGEAVQQRRLQPVRGYLGSTAYRLHFGLGDSKSIDEVLLTWPDGQTERYTALTPNTLWVPNPAEAGQPKVEVITDRLFTNETVNANILFRHKENAYNDFETEILLPHKMSEWGPGIVAADFNGDGLDDLWHGGGAGQPGALFIQQPDGRFIQTDQPALNGHAGFEDVDGVAFDANGDGFTDLFVVSGDASGGEGGMVLRDRLYLNDGKGRLYDQTGRLPDLRTAGGSVCVADVNGDGRPDVFVGGRNVPGKYPMAPMSYLLINTGEVFDDGSAEWFGNDFPAGMVTASVFHDFNTDGFPDLLLTGEWMAPAIRLNTGTGFAPPVEIAPNQQGWWFSLAVADLNNDGIDDIIAGNLGENNKFHPSVNEPLVCYANDFDRNGTLDIVLSKKGLPVRGRECSSAQMPFVAEKFPSYEAFATSSTEEIYGSGALNNSMQLKAINFSTTVFYGTKEGRYDAVALPFQTQWAPVRSVVVEDLNKDGRLDLILSGNFFGTEVETTRYDAGNGCVLLNQGDGKFRALLPHESGLSLPYDMRKSVVVNGPGTKKRLISSANQSFPVVHRMP